jgi:hypothetical protein
MALTTVNLSRTTKIGNWVPSRKEDPEMRTCGKPNSSVSKT